jgi:hypothetical protein
MFWWSGWNLFMRGRWCLKMWFRRLIQYRDPQFNMFNLILIFMICVYTSEFVQMIKLPLNNCFILRGFKKDYISRKDEFILCLIVKMISLGGILVPQEYALMINCFKISSLLLRNQVIAGGTKDLKMPHRRNASIPYFIRILVSNSMIWNHVSHIHCT